LASRARGLAAGLTGTPSRARGLAAGLTGTPSRARGLAAALGAIALAGCSSTTPSLSSFKSGFAADRAQFRKLGQDLEATVGNAKNKTDAQLAGELEPLSTRARQQGAQLAKLKPPPKYKTDLAQLVAGFDAMAVDLKQIATAATRNDAQAASTATRALVADATKIKAADRAIASGLRESSS
jgi:hypothetical protein